MFQGRSFAAKLLLLAAVTSGLAVVAQAITFQTIDWLNIRPAALADATTLAKTIAATLPGTLSFDRPDETRQALAPFSMDPGVLAVFVYKGTTPYASYQRQPDNEPAPPTAPPAGHEFSGQRLLVTEPIVYEQDHLGVLLLVYDLQPMYAQLVRRIYLAIVVGAVSLGASLLLAMRLQKLLAAPVAELAGVAREVSTTRNYGLRAQRYSDDELGQLTDAFNQMLTQIGEREAELRAAQEALGHSEERFRKIVDNALDAVVTMDDRGRITGWNTQAERTFGFLATEAIGHPLADLIIPSSLREAHRTGLERFLATGEGPVLNKRIEITALRRGGEEFPVELAITPIRLERTIQFSAFIQDITLRRQAESDLARERLLLRALIDNAPDCIFIKDASFRFLMNNPAHLKILGVESQEQAVGKADHDFFPKPLADRYRTDDAQVLSSGRPLLNREEPVVGADGRLRWMAASKIPLTGPDGKPNRLIGLSRDITDLRDARERLEQINAELTQKNQEMEQFVYTVSHDLKSPIVTCVGFLGLMKEDLQNQQYQALPDSMQRLERAVARMHQSINDLLELSRVGRVRSKPEQINMNELLLQLAEEMAPRLKEKNIRLDIGPNLPPIIAERNRVTEVFENLISNAVKYGSDVPEPRIEVGWQEADDEARFFVRDNGPGIPPEYHKRIFGLFQRLDNKKEGTGVGLTIVQRIMEVHGGRVWVESKAGRGATFWLAFPLAVVEPEEQAAPS